MTDEHAPRWTRRSRRDRRSTTDLRHLWPALLRSRRQAVDTGEVRRMWPDALLDLATVTWWRGVYWPIADRVPHRRLPTGCPLCRTAEQVQR